MEGEATLRGLEKGPSYVQLFMPTVGFDLGKGQCNQGDFFHMQTFNILAHGTPAMGWPQVSDGCDSFVS